MRKTFSREIATCMFLWLGFLSYDNANQEMVETLIWPVSTFGLFAFGFKQPVVGDSLRGRTSKSTDGRGS